MGLYDITLKILLLKENGFDHFISPLLTLSEEFRHQLYSNPSHSSRTCPSRHTSPWQPPERLSCTKPQWQQTSFDPSYDSALSSSCWNERRWHYFSVLLLSLVRTSSYATRSFGTPARVNSSAEATRLLDLVTAFDHNDNERAWLSPTPADPAFKSSRTEVSRPLKLGTWNTYPPYASMIPTQVRIFRLLEDWWDVQSGKWCLAGPHGCRQSATWACEHQNQFLRWNRLCDLDVYSQPAPDRKRWGSQSWDSCFND